MWKNWPLYLFADSKTWVGQIDNAKLKYLGLPFIFAFMPPFSSAMTCISNQNIRQVPVGDGTRLDQPIQGAAGRHPRELKALHNIRPC